MVPYYLEKLIIAAVIGIAVSAITTPISIKVANRFGIIDRPRDDRRIHDRPIPRFGGMGIFLGTMAALTISVGMSDKIATAMLGGVLMYLLGVVDDIKDLRPSIKFGGQVAIASLMFAMGIKITFVGNYIASTTAKLETIMPLDTGVAYIVTVLWIVGITNAVNLMDGMDGLAAGSVAIMALSLAYVAYIHGARLGMMAICVALVGVAASCVGFLPYNISPAKTFMGDGGSLFLGYMIAILSVISPLKRATFIGTIIPIVALAVPIFDTLFAMIRRMYRREPIMKADKGHLHHRLMAAGFGQRRSVLVMYGIVGIMGEVAVLFSRELYKDAFFLFAIACLYLFIILVPKQPFEKREARVEYMKQRREEIRKEKDAENK